MKKFFSIASMEINIKKVVLGFSLKLSGDNSFNSKKLIQRGRILKCFCFVLLAAALVRSLPGYISDLNFQNISIEDGLSQNTITCILQDRRNFMWFGSEEGLNRYDGIRFKIYRYNRSGRNCLSHDRISCMLEDADGSLWIGTAGGGLNLLDVASDHFTQFHYNAADPNSLSNDTVRAILADGAGSLWIGTDSGLNRFDRQSGKFTRILHPHERVGYASPCIINCLYLGKDGVLWVGTGHGLYRYDPASGACISVRGSVDPAPGMLPGRDQINSIFEDNAGNIWLGTEAGLALFDKQDGSFQFKEGEDSPLPHLYRSRILRILYDDRGGVWIASEAGIYFFPHDGQLAVYFRAGAVPRRMLKDCFVVSLYQDPEGILWAGTFSGIFKYDLRTRQFALCGPEFNEKEKDDFRLPVAAICQDRRQWLWIGTYKTGLYGINRSSEEKKIFLFLPGSPQHLREILVSALQIDRRQTLWIGTSTGLHTYDIVKDSFTGYYHSGEKGGGLSYDWITAIFEDRSGRLWVGSEDGLNLFDRDRGTFSVYRNDLTTAPLIGRNQISTIYQDASGAMWIGTYGGGLCLFSPERGRFVRNYRHSDNDNASLNSDKVYCLLEDRRGRFWVGTNSGGLNLFDRASGKFTIFTTEDGLPNNSILGMLEDRHGNLWLSTSRGLCRFDPELKIFRNFTARDGLQGDEFFPRSYYKSGNDELFFGGPSGLTCFFPQDIRDNPHVPPVTITEVTIFNRGQTFSGEFNHMKTLKLGPEDRIVSFAFAALSYSDPRRNQYAYKIEGLNDNWIQIGNRHEVTVSNLRPGSYIFRVKGSNNHGLWNEQGAALAIVMRPPWWETWWFRVPVFILLFFLFIWLNRTRTKRLAARIRTEATMEQYLSKCGISQREKEIVLLLLKGKSNKEIEDVLFIAMGTVKNHIYSIYQKIGVKNRAQLITFFKNLQVK
jgi:ligand-binding sensor domain-containing protein/DNA-binding CsgD family transcriptional regulator